MKNILIAICFLLSVHSVSAYESMPDARANQIADAIYKIENSKQYPYGIRSIPIQGKTQIERELYARRICINTIKNNYVRWQKAGSKGAYLDYLASVYCPKSADPIGNKNWIKNIHLMVKN